VDWIAEASHLDVSLGGRPVLAGIDLSLRPGDSVGIAGPNGSGKTTLVRTFATLTRIANGELRLFGNPVSAATVTELRSRIGLIGHHPTLISELTLSENLQHVCRLRGIDTSRVPNALDVVGLSGAAERRAEACSFGMRRRVEIAHLLLARPSLVLLDEAASGLDDAARDLIGALIASVRGRGGAALVVSHDFGQLSSLCDRVIGLDNGRLVEA
jgi:ABC-type multidrug transport system ATPase subunit